MSCSEFNQLTEMCIRKIDEELENNSHAPFQFFWYDRTTGWQMADEFVVFKVFRNGDNLEIVPAHLEALYKHSVSYSVGAKVKDKKYANFYYQHMRYVLTRYDIEKIIDEIKKVDPDLWKLPEQTASIKVNKVKNIGFYKTNIQDNVVSAQMDFIGIKK